jgi:hypothetical protein
LKEPEATVQQEQKVAEPEEKKIEEPVKVE